MKFLSGLILIGLLYVGCGDEDTTSPKSSGYKGGSFKFVSVSGGGTCPYSQPTGNFNLIINGDDAQIEYSGLSLVGSYDSDNHSGRVREDWDGSIYCVKLKVQQPTEIAITIVFEFSDENTLIGTYYSSENTTYVNEYCPRYSCLNTYSIKAERL